MVSLVINQTNRTNHTNRINSICLPDHAHSLPKLKDHNRLKLSGLHRCLSDHRLMEEVSVMSARGCICSHAPLKRGLWSRLRRDYPLRLGIHSILELVPNNGTQTTRTVLRNVLPRQAGSQPCSKSLARKHPPFRTVLPVIRNFWSRGPFANIRSWDRPVRPGVTYSTCY